MKFVLLLCIFFGGFVYAKEVYATFDVVGEKDSKLALSSAGVIKHLFVRAGDQVQKGDVLLELDNALENGDEALAISEVKLAQISLELVQKKFDRYTKIQNAIDKERYENIVYELKKAKQAYDKAQKALELKKIKKQKKILLAPYDGVITSVHVELGEGVNAVSTPLLTLSSFPHVKLVLNFDQMYWNLVRVGQKFRYRIEGLDKEFEGTISKVYPSANIQNRKIKAEVLTQNIPTGLFGDGKIVAE
ncbi:MAG: efflux RND transporter periplasmic adaptor subunit [Sulfurospirillum sp.]|nr:efflux RND transporter periplasmic adaptor subunit [Sulfurospirillum sp.]